MVCASRLDFLTKLVSAADPKLLGFQDRLHIVLGHQERAGLDNPDGLQTIPWLMRRDRHAISPLDVGLLVNVEQQVI